MLQSLRDKSQGWLAWVIIGLIALTFVLFGASNLLSSNANDQIAAKVNGQKITQRELDIAYDNILQQPGSEALRSLDQKAIKKDILNSLIEQALITQQAERMGMRVSDQLINSRIESFPFLQKDNQFSPDLYRRFLSTANYSDQEFRALLREDTLRNQLLQGVSQTAFATTADVDEAVSLMNQKRGFRVSRYLRDAYQQGLTVSQEDIENYYRANLDQFKTDEKVKLNYIVLSLPDFAEKFSPDQKMIEAYYNSHLQEFTEPEKIKIAHILAAFPPEADEMQEKAAKEKIDIIVGKLQNGQPFAEVAQTDSEDKASSAEGGELSWFSKGEMIPEIEQAVVDLKPGETSGVVRTRFGYHVFRLLDRHPQKVSDFETVQAEIKQQLQAQMAEEKFLQAVDDLAVHAYDSPDSLQPAADAIEQPIQISEIFGVRAGPNESVLKNPQVLAAALSPSVLIDKLNSDLIKIDDENYIVLRAAEYVPSLQKPLSDVQPEVEAELLQEKSSELAKQAALRAQSALLQTKTTLTSDVMQQYDWETFDEVTRSDTAVNSDILSAAFSMPDVVHENDKIMKVAEFDDGSYALIWLLSVENGQPDAVSTEQKKSYTQSLNHQFGELDIALYVKGLSSLAKIKNEVDVPENG